MLVTLRPSLSWHFHSTPILHIRYSITAGCTQLPLNAAHNCHLMLHTTWCIVLRCIGQSNVHIQWCIRQSNVHIQWCIGQTSVRLVALEQCVAVYNALSGCRSSVWLLIAACMQFRFITAEYIALSGAAVVRSNSA